MVLETHFAGCRSRNRSCWLITLLRRNRPNPLSSTWLRAGEQALARSAMREAEALLRKGSGLLQNLTDSVWACECELDLRIALGRALLTIQGWGAPVVGETYTRARQLCDSLGRPNKLPPILYGQWVHHLQRGDLRKARDFALETRQLGEASKDIVARATGCRTSGVTYMYSGDFAVARAYFEQGLELSDPAHLDLYAKLSPPEASVTLMANLSVTLACSGLVDRARNQCQAALAEARRLDHAHTLAYALWAAVITGWVTRSEPAEVLQLSNEFLAITDEQGFPLFGALARGHRGWCLAALGRTGRRNCAPEHWPARVSLYRKRCCRIAVADDAGRRL